MCDLVFDPIVDGVEPTIPHGSRLVRTCPREHLADETLARCILLGPSHCDQPTRMMGRRSRASRPRPTRRTHTVRRPRIGPCCQSRSIADPWILSSVRLRVSAIPGPAPRPQYWPSRWWRVLPNPRQKWRTVQTHTRALQVRCASARLMERSWYEDQVGLEVKTLRASTWGVCTLPNGVYGLTRRNPLGASRRNLVVHRRRAGGQSHPIVFTSDRRRCQRDGFRSSRPQLAPCTDRRVERQVESKAWNIPSTPNCDPGLHIWFSSSLPRSGIFFTDIQGACRSW